jgi:hypothetical protein
MSAVGVGVVTAARTVGVDRGTLRRWRYRRAHGRPLAGRRGPRPLPVAPESRGQAETLVRELRGLVGVEALRHRCPGLTRRGATRIKAETCAAIERERRGTAAHVELSAPGVIRGFDCMELGPAGHLLVSGDGAVPYRTSWTVAARYDGASVAGALADDFARNGPPLVLRLDRAWQHDVAAVHAVLAAYAVIPVHGPPRYPQYYGQLERLNRDQRAWLRHADEPLTKATIDHMMQSLNNLWPRRRLGWKMAAQAWSKRPALDVNRVELRKEVERTCNRLITHDGVNPDVGWRLAVKLALTKRGLLRVVPGGGC